MIKADVVALDQAIVYNRLGTVNPNGMIYALKRDIVAIDPLKGLSAGNVRLRRQTTAATRPAHEHRRLFENQLYESTFKRAKVVGPHPSDDQPSTRSAGVHVIGMELVGDITSDGSNVGTSPPSLVPRTTLNHIPSPPHVKQPDVQHRRYDWRRGRWRNASRGLVWQR